MHLLGNLSCLRGIKVWWHRCHCPLSHSVSGKAPSVEILLGFWFCWFVLNGLWNRAREISLSDRQVSFTFTCMTSAVAVKCLNSAQAERRSSPWMFTQSSHWCGWALKTPGCCLGGLALCSQGAVLVLLQCCSRWTWALSGSPVHPFTAWMFVMYVCRFGQKCRLNKMHVNLSWEMKLTSLWKRPDELHTPCLTECHFCFSNRNKTSVNSKVIAVTVRPELTFAEIHLEIELAHLANVSHLYHVLLCLYRIVFIIS